MNINASIIDQRLAGMQDELKDLAREELGINDAGRLKSIAFVHLCVTRVEVLSRFKEEI
jgi:hypothetical protein